MDPIRKVQVTFTWIFMIVCLISLIVFIFARIIKNKKLAKYAGIIFVISFILLVITFIFAVHLQRSGVQ